MTPGTQDRRFKVSWSVSAHARRLLTLALAGLAVAVLTQRAAFAAAAAPAVVLLTAWRRDRPERIRVLLRPTTLRVHENEQAAIHAMIAGTGDFTVDLLLRPAEAVEMPDRARRAVTPAPGAAAPLAGPPAAWVALPIRDAAPRCRCRSWSGAGGAAGSAPRK